MNATAEHATRMAKMVRVVVLVTAALAALQRGVLYLPGVDDVPSVALTYVEFWLPLSAWAAVWLALGGILVVSIALPVLIIPAMSAFVGLHIVWSASLVASWLMLDQPETWVTGATHACIAMFAAALLVTFDSPNPAAHI